MHFLVKTALFAGLVWNVLYLTFLKLRLTKLVQIDPDLFKLSTVLLHWQHWRHLYELKYR